MISLIARKNLIRGTMTLTFISLLFLFGQVGLAVNGQPDPPDQCVYSSTDDPYGLKTTACKALGKKTDPKSLPETIGIIIGIVLSFLGIIFFILIIYGGFLWMTAHGNEEQIKKARNIIVNATIGLAIVLAAYAITAFITTEFQKAAVP
jgi:hypothetical protein